ncbi:MAG TPA: PTS lactose/cellobiose transporter subunit IIA [Candidatus Limicola stercorigallinarum]|nr:PTS lactose/cellobiose transporter subunit IIA [Candidatus Limicola stercorigallinarum]
MKQQTLEELIPAAMDIVVHAGDARLYARNALKAVQEQDFEKADAELKQAQHEIELAHASQTTIVQNEARGAEYEYSMLFNHAQDTLMTINSEIELTRSLVDTFRVYSGMISQLAAQTQANQSEVCA